MLQISLLY